MKHSNHLPASEISDHPPKEPLIGTIADLPVWRSMLLEKTIVLATGCFDLLHIGHLYFLRQACEQADVLVVGVNSDRSVQVIKGEKRPIVRQEQRAELVAAFRCVDYVFIYDDIVADDCIISLNPDVYAVGEESVKAYPSEVMVAANTGTRIHVVKRIPSISTTAIVANVLVNEERR